MRVLRAIAATSKRPHRRGDHRHLHGCGDARRVGLTPHDPLQQFRIDRLKAPSATYWMGTDLFGRDTFSRLMLGIGQSFIIAFSSVALATVAGTVIGLFAAWWGHLWDGVLMRVMDVLLAFPAILLAMLIVAVAGPGTLTSIAAIAHRLHADLRPRRARTGTVAEAARFRRCGAHLRQLAGLHPHPPPAAQPRRAADRAGDAGAGLGAADRSWPELSRPRHAAAGALAWRHAVRQPAI